MILRAGAILADPPWWWKPYSAKGEGRSARRHYKDRRVMTLAEIKAYSVAEKAAADCFLFLWAPSSHVTHVGEVMNAWSFDFSGKAFTWVKLTRGSKRDDRRALAGFPLLTVSDYRTFVRTGKGFHFGMGKGTRRNPEECWLGRRGNPKRLSAGVPELIIAPVREHSR
jgi:N6-adenosine-specific RNA methylase IME4